MCIHCYWSFIVITDDVFISLSRCSRKHQCQRHMQPNHWLWSFEPTNQCVTVQSLQPANQSKDEQTQVSCCEAANIDYLDKQLDSFPFNLTCRQIIHQPINFIYLVRVMSSSHNSVHDRDFLLYRASERLLCFLLWSTAELIYYDSHMDVYNIYYGAVFEMCLLSSHP